MELKSVLSRSAIVVGVLIGIFILLTLRRLNTDHPRPTPRTVEIPDGIRQKFANPSERSVKPEPFASIEHDSSINAIAFSPVDASLVVSGTGIGTNQPIKLWDLNDTSEPIAVFDGETATFSPDGQLLIIAGWMEGAKLWHVAEKRYISDFDRFARCATFSPDGKWVASGYKDIKLWDIRSLGRIVEVSTLSKETFLKKLGFSPKTSLKKLVFSADGKLLATVNQGSNKVSVWDVESKQVINTLKQGKWWTEAIKFSPDTENPRFALADSRGNIKLYTLLDWNLHATISTATADDLAFTPDGKTLVSIGIGEVEFWSIENGRRTASLHGYSPWATSVALSADGTTLASGGSDRVLRVWNTSQYLEPYQSVSQGIVRLIYFLPSDRTAQPDIPEKLGHDFREASYLMSYGRAKNRLSEGNAEWLNKSRSFNPDRPFFDEPAAIEIAASSVNPSKSKVLRFHLKDVDGLHQAMLLIPPTAGTPPPGYQTSKNTEDNKRNWKKKVKGKSLVLHDYRSLNAQKAATVEFNLPELRKNSVELRIIDVHGNITYRTFDLSEDIAGLVK